MKKIIFTISFLFIFILGVSPITAKSINYEKVKANKIWVLSISNPKTQSIKILDDDNKIVKAKIIISGKKITIKPPVNGWEDDTNYRIMLYTKNGTKTTSKVLKYFQLEEEKVVFIDENSPEVDKDKTPLKIKSIAEITATINHNEFFNLPNTVIATMEDNSTQEIGVAWDNNSIMASKVGENVYYLDGNIEGYNEQIKVILNVIPIIKSVNDNFLYLWHNQKYDLPKTITAEMSDGSKKEIPVKWDRESIDTSKIGYVEMKGTVEGFNRFTTWFVNIQPTIVSVEDVKKYIKIGSNYELPNSLKVTLSDNTKTTAYVKWNYDKVNKEVVGVYNVNGYIEEYNYNMSATLIVLPLIESLLEPEITIYQGDNYELPKTVKVKMTDGTIVDLEVEWMSTFNPQLIGVFDYYGFASYYQYGKEKTQFYSVRILINVIKK